MAEERRIKLQVNNNNITTTASPLIETMRSDAAGNNDI